MPPTPYARSALSLDEPMRISAPRGPRSPRPTSRYRRSEQPLWLKAFVTLIAAWGTVYSVAQMAGPSPIFAIRTCANGATLVRMGRGLYLRKADGTIAMRVSEHHAEFACGR